MLTSRQRAVLRAQSNSLDVVFQVGKGEIDEALIKMKVLENSAYTPREAAELLAQATGSEVVQVIGSRFVLYLQKKKDSRYAPLLDSRR